MAQHIDKQITDISFTTNALQNGAKVGPSSHGVLMQPRENIGEL